MHDISSQEKENRNDTEMREKKARKLKSLMALFNVYKICLEPEREAGPLEVEMCLDRMDELVEPPTPEIDLIAKELANAVFENRKEIANLAYDNPTGEIILDGGILRVRASVMYEDTEPADDIADVLDPEDYGDTATQIITKLSGAGITKVTFDYSGSGDSGGVTEINFFRGESMLKDSEVPRMLSWEIEGFVYNRAQPNFDNEGSSGEASIELGDEGYNFSINHRNNVYKSYDMEEEF